MSSDQSAHEFKQRQRQQWSVGDYVAFAEALRHSSRKLIRRLDIAPGMRVLDIGTGTGGAALEAAMMGADVIGVDITPELFDEGAHHADEAGLAIQWDEGDASALPYPDASFDCVVSAFALMYVPDPHAAVSELIRVLRPGGRFGITNWSARGLVETVLHALGGIGLPATATPELLPWGDENHVRDFFGPTATDLAFERDAVTWLFPSAEEGVRWLESTSGAVIAARSAMMATDTWKDVRAQLVQEVAQLTRKDMEGIWPRAECLRILGTRPTN